jgi:hypothetical protein
MFIDIDIEEHDWNGFTLVMDNLDMNINPRYRRVDRQTTSLHFCQSFAVRDRINLVDASNNPSSYINIPTEKLPLDVILPTSSDDQSLTYNFAILASRVIVKKLPYFQKTFEGVNIYHIEHMHTEEMGKKSQCVSS